MTGVLSKMMNGAIHNRHFWADTAPLINIFQLHEIKRQGK